MPIKAALLDLDGTLIANNALVPGVVDMITRLQQRGVAVFVASNQPRLLGPEMKLACIPEENFLYYENVGVRKGGGRFVDTVCSGMGIRYNELVYLGDTDNDMREAVRHQVALFLAAWSAPTYKYGIPVQEPSHFAQIIETFFLKDRLWYYKVDGADRLGRPVMVRALLSATDCIRAGVQDLLKKKIPGPPVGRLSLATFLSYHLLASIYLEGLHLRGTPGNPLVWCVYPAHQGGQTGVLVDFSVLMSRLLREQYRPDLLVRHRPAIKSATARKRGVNPPIGNQFQTVMLNAHYRDKIVGRTVIVLDDFTTHAQSFETARNLLLNAGAGEVVSVAVGKYMVPYLAHSLKAGIDLDSFQPNALDTDSFDQQQVTAVVDQDAVIRFTL